MASNPNGPLGGGHRGTRGDPLHSALEPGLQHQVRLHLRHHAGGGLRRLLPGYTSSYIYHGVPVYGTGWYYRPWWGSYHYYPRYPTWGFNVRYNPWYGWSFGLSYSTGRFTFSIGYGGWLPAWLVGTGRLSRLSARLPQRLAPRLSGGYPDRLPGGLPIRQAGFGAQHVSASGERQQGRPHLGSQARRGHSADQVTERVEPGEQRLYRQERRRFSEAAGR